MSNNHEEQVKELREEFEQKFGEFDKSEDLRMIDKILVFQRNKGLNATEKRVICACLKLDISYEKMSEIGIKGDIGTLASNIIRQIRNWLKESGLLEQEEKLEKLNLSTKWGLLREEIKTKLDASEATRTASNPPNINTPYIKRNIVSQCTSYLKRTSGPIACIEGGPQTGKTTALNEALDELEQMGYLTILIDLRDRDDNDLTNINTFMKSLCRKIVNSECLDSSFDKEQFNNTLDEADISWTHFFQRNLLSKIEKPLILAIDNFHKLYAHPDIYTKFYGEYLRVWSDKAKQRGKTGKAWKKLNVVLAYCDMQSPTLPSEYSGPNTWQPFYLKEFELKEVVALAKQRGLDERWKGDLKKSCTDLVKLVGGHSYLISLAVQILENGQMTLEKLLELAPTEEGIYIHFLRDRLLATLQKDNKLVLAYQKVVSDDPVEATEIYDSYQTLRGLGLIKVSEDYCEPSCNLYRQYFRKHLPALLSQDKSS